MLAALDGDPFVTLGCSSRDINAEAVWNAHLRKLARKSGKQRTGATGQLRAAGQRGGSRHLWPAPCAALHAQPSATRDGQQARMPRSA